MSELPQGWAVVEDEPATLPAGWQVVPDAPAVAEPQSAAGGAQSRLLDLQDMQTRTPAVTGNSVPAGPAPDLLNLARRAVYAADKYVPDPVDLVTRAAKSGVEAVGNIVSGAGRFAELQANALDAINPTAKAMESPDNNIAAIMAQKNKAPGAIAAGKAVSRLADYYKPDTTRDKDLSSQLAEFAGTIAPVTASGPLALMTGASLLGEQMRDKAIQGGDTDDVADAKFVLGTTVGMAAGAAPGSKLLQRLVPPSAVLRAPVAAAATEVGAHALAGFTAGTAMDATLQALTEDRIDWSQALKIGAFTSVLGTIGGALKAAEASRLTKVDREGLFDLARKLGFQGDTIDDLRNWHDQREAAIKILKEKNVTPSTQDSSARLEQLPHTETVAGSNPAPAPVSTEPTEAVTTPVAQEAIPTAPPEVAGPQLPPGWTVVTNTPVEPNGIQPNQPAARYNDFIAKSLQRNSDAAKGQAVLDDLESRDISPTSVVQEFWDKTYHSLTPAQQQQFHSLIQKETGLKPGDIIAHRPGTEEVDKANNWQDIYPSSQVPDEIGYLEGTERGLISLMAVANSLHAKTIPAISDVQSNPPTEPAPEVVGGTTNPAPADVVNAAAGAGPVGVPNNSAAGGQLPTATQPQGNAPAETAPAKGQQGSGNEVVTPPNVQRKRIGLPATGETDLLNAIQDLGGIKHPKNVTQKVGGEYDGFKDAMSNGLPRMLVRRDGGGSTPDQILGELADNGYKFNTPDELFSAISKATDERKVMRKAVGVQSYISRFEQAFLGNAQQKPWLKAGQPISIDELHAGEEFEVNGEKFTVQGIDENGYVTVKDGITRKIAPGTNVYPDKGTLKKVSRDIPDFAPPSDSGELFPTEETPFNLAGETQKAPAQPMKEPAIGPEQGEMFEVQKIVQHVDPVKSADAAQELYGNPAQAADRLEHQLAVFDSDPTNRKNFDKQQRSRLKEVVALLRQRAKTYKPSGSAASPGHATAPPRQQPPVFLRPTDDPNFSQLPFQLPEMVQFYRMISGGKNPRIIERIRVLHGTALGVFRYIEGNIDSGKIELRADLFHLLSQQEKDELMKKAVAWAKLMNEANPDMDLRDAIRHKFEQLVSEAEAEAMKRDPGRALATFAHEIGHYIDFIPHATLTRGNILGHMASLYSYLKNFIGSAPDIYPFPPTDNERAAMRRKAEKELNDAVKEITETITREEPIYETSGITAKMITEVVGQTAREEFPEFYDWFARLSRPEKVAVLKQAMRGIVDERAAKFGKRVQTGTKTVTETITHKTAEVTEEDIKARYRELLREDLKRRGLISIYDIKKELEGVIAWWNKRETMPAYFKTGVEMYAETFSILMNNPRALQERAPTWWSAFQQYLVRKPAIKKVYDQVQNDIKSGAIFAQRVNNLRGSWEKDEAAGLSRELAQEKIPWRQYKDSFNLLFNKQQGPAQALAAKQLGKPEANQLLSAFKDYLYRQTAIEGLARQINMRVEAPLAAQSLNHADLSEFMFHNRIVNGDAVETANSQGWSPNTSTQRLDEMKKDLGEARFNTLRDATDQLRAIYEAGPIKLLQISRTLNPETMQKIVTNIAYSPFQKAREAFNPLDEGTIHGMLEAQYGTAATARIYRRIGTLSDIQSPYMALVKKAEALTRFAYKQIATKALRDFMLEYQHDSIEQAPKSYNGHRLVPRDIDTPTVGTIYTLDDGVLTGWYVPRAIFETLEHASGTEQMMLGAALKLLSWPKAILTELNFGFWPVNFARDLGAFGVQMKGGIGALKRLPQAYAAARATITSKPNPVADQLLSRLMIISRADPRGEHLGHPDEMDRWLLRMNKHPELWDAETKKMGMLLRFWEGYKAQGQILERTTKALGMMHLDAKYGASMPDIPNIQWVTMPEWMKKRMVNELAGSPDFNERGRGIAFVEVAGGPIFANAWLRGVESFYKAQKQDPAGVWGKFLLLFALPALAFYAYEKGWTNFGVDPHKAEDERAMLRSIPERDKLRGFVKVLGWSDKAQGKVAYIVLPFPEQVRTLHALWRKMLQSFNHDQGKKLGAMSMVNYQGQDLPGQNPLLSEAGKWWEFAALGHNPYDSFRGKTVLDDKVFTAGQGAGQLAKQTAANLFSIAIPQPLPNVPGEKATELEAFLHRPLVSNLLGRWVRVSNAGLSETDANVIQPVDQRRAQLQIVGDEMLRKTSAGEKWTDGERQLLSVEPYLGSYMMDRFKVYQSNASGPEIRDFMKANNEERAALLKAWIDREHAIEARLMANKPGRN